MDKQIKDMSGTEFRSFVAPFMIAEAENLGNIPDDDPFVFVLRQVLNLADTQVAEMMLERLMGKANQDTTPHGMYTTIFLLGMLCEREGWHLE